MPRAYIGLMSSFFHPVLAFVVLSMAVAVQCMASEPPQLPPELQGVITMIEEYRTIPSLHVKSVWETTLDRNCCNAAKMSPV